MTLSLRLVRDNNPAQQHNWGKFFVNGIYLCETLEDEDRFLETGGVKVYGETAIPRGVYKVILDYSAHFGRTMPHLLDVPQFDGVRLHGGNKEADTLGCPLLGHVRTADGIADCAGANQRLMNMLDSATKDGEDIVIEVC